jgi:uncharacterized cupin superfamily protein
MDLPTEIRRVVTGHDATGKAVVLSDSADPHKIVRPATGVVNRLMWMTDATPADIAGKRDHEAGVEGVGPPDGGTSFRIIDFPPMTDAEIAAFTADHVAKQFGNAPDVAGYRPPSHPFMHRTRTLDFAIVLAGEIDMKLDDDEPLHLSAGDVLIQQGTNHAWINRSGKPCRIAFTFLDAVEPLGGPSTPRQAQDRPSSG